MVGNVNRCRVLVTGGTGYLGARIGKSLAEQGYDVCLGSRYPFANGTVEGCRQAATDWKDSEFKFCKGFDLIIHAAGMNAEDCAQNPEMAYRFNGLLTEKLIERAIDFGCKRFFYLSTVHVYNAPLIGRFNESSDTLNKHPYATSHLCGEQALIKALANKSINGAVLRLSNCFGIPISNTRDCWALVVNEFVRDAVKNKQIIINGNCQSKRDFLPISDLTNILTEILNYSNCMPNIINVSSGQSRSLDEVANLVSEFTSHVIGQKVPILKRSSSAPEGDLFIVNRSLTDMGIHVHTTLQRELGDLISGVIKSY